MTDVNLLKQISEETDQGLKLQGKPFVFLLFLLFNLSEEGYCSSYFR